MLTMIRLVFNVYSALILIRVLLSWISHDPNGQFVKYVYILTEPVLAPFRRILRPNPGFPFDFSALFALIAVQIVEALLIRLIIF